MADTTSLLVELLCVAASWMGEGELHGELQKTRSYLEHGYEVRMDWPVCKRKYSKLLESCFIWDMPKFLYLTNSSSSLRILRFLRARAFGKRGAYSSTKSN